MSQRKRTKNKLRSILKLTLKPKLWFVFIIPVFTILIGQKSVASSWLVSQIFNNLQLLVQNRTNDYLLKHAIICALLLFGLELVKWVLATISGIIENYWRECINIEIQNRFMTKEYKSDITDFDNSELTNHRLVAKSVDLVSIIKTIVDFFSIIFVTVSYGVILWSYHPALVIIALIIKVPTFFLYDKTMKLNRDFKIQSGDMSRKLKYFHGIPIDRSVAKEYKIFNMKDFVCDKYDQENNKYFTFYKKVFARRITYNSLLMHYDKLITLGIEIIIGFSVFSGQLLFGQFTLFVAAFNNLSSSMEIVLDHISRFKEMKVQTDMLVDYLDDENIYEKSELYSKSAGNISHYIELRNVSFTYPGTDKEILHNLNLTISAGKTHGLVGLNGSGKSTLVNLLLRLYEPDSGEILLDGVNIKEYNIHSYYESIACVFQNTTHYAMPIKDYVSAGKPCDIDKAQAAIKQVKLDKWCDELPHGLDTMLTRAFTSETDSVEPSIGQWQKLSIARAIYKDAPIMILDEPSASLDVDSENEIFNYITQLTVKKTAILISHRLSNIIGCDHIFVLQDGCLVEQGNHQTLLEMGGIYANLFNSQAKYYKAE